MDQDQWERVLESLPDAVESRYGHLESTKMLNYMTDLSPIPRARNPGMERVRSAFIGCQGLGSGFRLLWRSTLG